VIGRNEGERLVRCLAAVQAMDYPAELLEKIYVDSESTDGSAERAAAAGFEVLRYRAEFRTAAGARNLGWRASRSRFVLFLDGDCVVDPDFLRHAVEHCVKDSAAAVNGRVEETAGRHGAPRRSLSLFWEVRMARAEGPSAYRGGCGLVERAALEEIGGFNPELASTENGDLGRRLAARGKRTWYADRPMVGHDSGLRSWTELFRHGVRDGYWFERTARIDGVDQRTPKAGPARATALRQTLPLLSVATAGWLLEGLAGLAIGAGLVAAFGLVKRSWAAGERKGRSLSNVGDGALLLAYDCMLWCGRMRYVVGALFGRPSALRTGPDWRSEDAAR